MSNMTFMELILEGIPEELPEYKILDNIMLLMRT